VDEIWLDHVCPLIESLLMTNRAQDAEGVLLDIARLPAFRGFQAKAAELAAKCGKSELQTRWAGLDIPEKTKPDLEDLDAALSPWAARISPANSPYLVTTHKGYRGENERLSAMLQQGRLADWGVSLQWDGLGDDDMSELLRKREGWPEGEPHWALFSAENKMLAHGPGAPSESHLCQILEDSNVETRANVLRRFLRDYPSRLDAMSDLMDELKRIAERETREAIGMGAGSDFSKLLSDKQDQEIWGEFLSRCRQLEQLKNGSSRYYLESELLFHSPSMKNFAHGLLPQIEADLVDGPMSPFLWRMWVTLSALEELHTFAELKDMLEPMPYSDPLLELPPTSVRKPLLKRYVAQANWQGILDLQEWRWEGLKGEIESILGLKREIELDRILLDFFDWNHETLPLLEAYLRLGKEKEASEIVETYSKAAWWNNIKQSAVAIAKRCGQEGLAEKWGR